jgi:hypothetical protein
MPAYPQQLPLESPAIEGHNIETRNAKYKYIKYQLIFRKWHKDDDFSFGWFQAAMASNLVLAALFIVNSLLGMRPLSIGNIER